LLSVPRYDFAWQNRYELATPIKLPAGSTLRCLATYDNSAANPANPNPDAVVRTGQQSWDEMFNGYYELALADEDLTRPPVRWAPLAALACGAALLLVRWSRLRPWILGGVFAPLSPWADDPTLFKDREAGFLPPSPPGRGPG
jgi:hypothetical protein